MSDQSIRLIDQRVIEANALAPVIKAFGEKIGLDAAKAVVQETHQNMSRGYGRACAACSGACFSQKSARPVKQIMRLITGPSRMGLDYFIRSHF